MQPQADRPTALIEQSVVDYLRSLQRRGAPASTVHTYEWALSDLVRFLAERRIRALNLISRQALEDWQDSQLERWLPKSRQLATTAIRGWLRWADERELVDPRMVRWVTTVKVPGKLPKPIEPEHLQMIMAFLGPERPYSSFWHLRDRALFYYLLETGGRINEALQLQTTGWVRYTVVQKGGREKIMELGETVQAMIREYLRHRDDDLPWLWVSMVRHELRKMTDNAANDAWAKIARIVGVPRWTSHRIRHTTGTELYRRTGDIYAVASHLGHSNLSSVQGYVKVAGEQRRKNIEVLEGMLSLQEEPEPQPAPPIVKGRPDTRPNRTPNRRAARRRKR